MGTDRVTIHDGSCKCGKGRIIVVECSPDHGYHTSAPFSYKLSIRCEDCDKEYALVEEGKSVLLVKREELKKRQEILKNVDQSSRALMGDPRIQEIVSRLQFTLEKMPSMASAHRFLAGSGLEYYSVGTFRRHWTNAETWIEANISIHNIVHVIQALALEDSGIVTEVKAIEAMRVQANKSLAGEGELICRTWRKT